MELAAPSSEAGPSSSRGELEASRHPSGIVPQLQNMVATVNLGCKLDLKQIALHARNSEYNPKASHTCCDTFQGHLQAGKGLVGWRFEMGKLDAEICGCHHADQGSKDDCSCLRFWKNGAPFGL